MRQNSYAPLVDDHGPPSPIGVNSSPPGESQSSVASNRHDGDVESPRFVVDAANPWPASATGDPGDGERVLLVLPVYSIALLISTITVLALCDFGSCDQPMANWVSVYVARQILKSMLYRVRSRLTREGRLIPPRLLWVIAMADLAGPTIWTLGGYFIFHTESCNCCIFTYACILWGIQSIGLLLPCCFLSTLIFCAPCLLWLAPYIIRPNPNTVATGREVMSKIPKIRFSDLAQPPGNISCTICLSDYLQEDEVMRLPCGHVFHAGCIESWLNVSQLCPIDRSNVAAAVTPAQPAGDELV